MGISEVGSQKCNEGGCTTFKNPPWSKIEKGPGPKGEEKSGPVLRGTRSEKTSVKRVWGKED